MRRVAFLYVDATRQMKDTFQKRSSRGTQSTIPFTFICVTIFPSQLQSYPNIALPISSTASAESEARAISQRCPGRAPANARVPGQEPANSTGSPDQNVAWEHPPRRHRDERDLSGQHEIDDRGRQD